MKKNYFILLLFTVLFSGMMLAQSEQKNFINYQGVARNATNDLMVGETLNVGISLKLGAATAGTSYSESHAVTTDANGVFSLLIGNGSPESGNYDDLAWGSAAAFVAVSINGTEIGTTEMMAVPYAISSGDAKQNADEVPYNNAISGLSATTTQDAIDELSTGGSVDADADPNNELQLLSFDSGTNELSLSDGNSVVIPSGGTDADADPSNELQTLNFDAATNELSLSDGNAVTIPSGGTDADADPTNEIQTLSFDAATNELSLTDGGAVTIPSGGTDADADPTNEIQDISLIGDELSISGGSTIVLPSGGGGTDDQNAAEVAFDNTTSGLIATNTQDAIDELVSSGGIDDDTDPTNELQTISFDGGTNELSLTDGGVVIIPSGGSSSGLEAISEGGQQGWRLVGRDADQYGDIGSDATDLSESDVIYTDKGATGSNSFATGFGTKASGNFSVAMGDLTTAIGSMSTALGESTSASGIASTAMGEFTQADGIAATSMGSLTQAFGRNATAMGEGTLARSFNSVALGRYNLGGGSIDSWVPEDPLFEIGNGTSNGDRSNVLTVLKSGFVGIGTAIPQVSLDVIGGIRLSELSGPDQRNVMADADGNLVIGTGGGGSSLWSGNGANINYSLGNVGIGISTPTNELHVNTPSGGSTLYTLDSYGTEATDGLSVGITDGIGAAIGLISMRENGPLRFQTNYQTRMSITGDGSVGIGTQTPETNLEVSGEDTVRHRMTSTNAGTVSLQWLREGAANTDWMMTAGSSGMEIGYSSSDLSGGLVHTRLSDDGVLEVRGSIRSGFLSGTGQRNVMADADGNLVIGAGGGGGVGSSLWSEDANGVNFSSGSVGIGGPSFLAAPLNVQSEYNTSLSLGSTRMNNIIEFSNADGYKGYAGIWNGDNDMDFGTGTFNTTGKTHLIASGLPQLTVVANGDVGIGTTDPTTKLDVNGDIKTSGEVHGAFTGNNNMLPIAYGTIRTDGSTASGSGNFRVLSGDFPGQYAIFIEGERYRLETHITTATIVDGVGFITVFTGTDAVAIRTKDINGVDTQISFSFVIYKP